MRRIAFFHKHQRNGSHYLCLTTKSFLLQQRETFRKLFTWINVTCQASDHQLIGCSPLTSRHQQDFDIFDANSPTRDRKWTGCGNNSWRSAKPCEILVPAPASSWLSWHQRASSDSSLVSIAGSFNPPWTAPPKHYRWTIDTNSLYLKVHELRTISSRVSNYPIGQWDTFRNQERVAYHQLKSNWPPSFSTWNTVLRSLARRSPSFTCNLMYMLSCACTAMELKINVMIEVTLKWPNDTVKVGSASEVSQ